MTNSLAGKLACLAFLFVFSARTSAAQTEGQLAGIIDEHTHSDPDNVPRRYDALQVVKDAKAAGMAGRRPQESRDAHHAARLYRE